MAPLYADAHGVESLKVTGKPAARHLNSSNQARFIAPIDYRIALAERWRG